MLMPRKVEPVVSSGLTAHNDPLGKRDGLTAFQILQKVLKAFQTVAEPKYLPGYLLPSLVECSGKIALTADIYPDT